MDVKNRRRRGGFSQVLANRIKRWLILAVLFVGLHFPDEARGTEQNTYPEEIHQRVLKKLNVLHRLSTDERVGEWSGWSPWTSCSRTCGTGVSIQFRECLPLQKRQRTQKVKKQLDNQCVGRYKRFQLCNVQICPEGFVDFRAEQCSSFNQTPFNKRFYSWEPFIDDPDSCILNCRAIGMSFYATLSQSVMDGTPCGGVRPEGLQEEVDRVCVEGKCMKLGCDGLLGSGRGVDACGICGGDNSSCRMISGVYTRASLPSGYNLIATLPPGAKNLSIYHIKPSRNYLALRELGGNYLLNGPWGLNASGSFNVSGTVFIYSRPHAYGGDHLYAKGPTSHSLDVMLFYQDANPGIKYEYRLPLLSVQRLPSSARGGPPFESQNEIVIRGRPANETPSIIRSTSSSKRTPLYLEGSKVAWSSIKDIKGGKKTRLGKQKLKKSKKQKTRKRYTWVSQGRTPCSRSCGGGTQSVRHVCVKRRNKLAQVPHEFCSHLYLPQNEVLQCNLKPCPPQWEATDWSECSATCGFGVQVRQLVCKQKTATDHHRSVTLADKECGKMATLPTAQVCQMRECDGPPRWDVGLWSACSSQCGLGTRRRKVTCTTIQGEVKEEFCKELKPVVEEMCDMGSCASDTWFFSAWESVCRGPCGNGVQKRHVHCSGDATEESKESSSCLQEPRPPDTRSCNNKNACGGSWFTGPWSNCDTSCGTGHQRRAVVCVTWHRGRYKVPRNPTLCKAAGEKPPESRPCATECRSQWFTSEWSECSAPCDGGVQRREVKCLDHRLHPSIRCSTAVKPDSRQSCNTQSCNAEENESDRLKNEVLERSTSFLNESVSSASSKYNSGKTSYGYSHHRGTSFILNGRTHFEPLEIFRGRTTKGSKGNATHRGISNVPLETSNDGEMAENVLVDHKDAYVVKSRKQMMDISEADKMAKWSNNSRYGDVQTEEAPVSPESAQRSGACIDRMKNCPLVFKARLCKLKYYNKLCCDTCSKH